MVRLPSLASVRTVPVACPVCGEPLPDAPVLVEAESAGRSALSLRVVDAIGPEWWAAAREAHPSCIPTTCSCGVALTAAHCLHCHDGPPAGHVCPRCGRTCGR